MEYFESSPRLLLEQRKNGQVTVHLEIANSNSVISSFLLFRTSKLFPLDLAFSPVILKFRYFERFLVSPEPGRGVGTPRKIVCDPQKVHMPFFYYVHQVPYAKRSSSCQLK